MKTAEAPKTELVSETVLLLNFGDGERVVHNAKGKPRNIQVGAAERIELSARSIERIKGRDPALVILPVDIADRSTSPLMRRVLEALKNFNNLSYDEALAVCVSVLGESAFDTPRPNKNEMRVALARRAKDAAYYIQKGAHETADQLLGLGREVKPLAQAADGLGLVQSDIVTGDPEEDDANGSTAKTQDDADGSGIESEDADSADQRHSEAEPDGNDQPNGADIPQHVDGAHGEALGGSESHGEAEAHGGRRIRPVTAETPASPASAERVRRPVKGE